jgi:hypothetical protein
MIVEGSSNRASLLTTKLIVEIDKELVENLVHRGNTKEVRFRESPVKERDILRVNRAMPIKRVATDIPEEISSRISDIVAMPRLLEL